MHLATIGDWDAWKPETAPQAIVINRYGKMLLSVKYRPCVVNSGMDYDGFKINAPIISTAIINSNAPKIGYIFPMILSTGNTVAIKK